MLTPDARHLFMGIRDFGGTGDLIAAYRVTAEGGLEWMTTVDVEDRIMDVVVR